MSIKFILMASSLLKLSYPILIILRIIFTPLFIKIEQLDNYRKIKLKGIKNSMEDLRNRYSSNKIQDNPKLIKLKNNERKKLFEEKGIPKYSYRKIKLSIQLILIFILTLNTKFFLNTLPIHFLWLNFSEPNVFLGIVASVLIVINLYMNNKQQKSIKINLYLIILILILMIILYSRIQSVITLYFIVHFICSIFEAYIINIKAKSEW